MRGPREEQQLAEEARFPVRVAASSRLSSSGGMLEQLDVLERPGDAEFGDTVRRHGGDVATLEAGARRSARRCG